MQIRTGRQEDAADLLEIMNYEITHNTATFDLQEKSPEEWQQWMERHGRDNHPLLVAEEDGRAVGYASLSPYRKKAGAADRRRRRCRNTDSCRSRSDSLCCFASS